MVHRLDRETGGVMVFAKTDTAGAELRRLWEAGLVTKEYVALVHGVPASSSGFIDAPLGPDTGSPVAVKDRVRNDGAPARTRWRRISVTGRAEGAFASVNVRIDTGRKHQIRIHLAHVGHPVVGDKIYGGDPGAYLEFVEGRLSEARRRRLLLPYHALHAVRLWFPWDGAERVFEAPPEPWFTGFAAGEPVVWFEDPYGPGPRATEAGSAEGCG
jgi:23S rRNA pseudouridine1911/1915/1917 synthase